jgi:rhodanese-related sulfurtransferase
MHLKIINMKSTLLLTLVLFFLSFGSSTVVAAPDSDTLWVGYTALQCDSLVQANATNPDFCVMDVRTWNEYFPDHIEGAINRDYYASNLQDLLDALPRSKMYMIYCAGGSRSINVFNMMKTMGFLQLVNMLGGLYAWENAFLPTTPDFAPLQMADSDTIFPPDTIQVGTVETIHLSVTNRANDTLRFTGITSLAGTEFSTDFDTTTTLEGPFIYNFSIFYTPVDELPDYISFLIHSNGGDVTFQVWRTGKIAAGISENQPGIHSSVCPNPFFNATIITYELPEPACVEVIIYNQCGQTVDKIVQQNGLKGMNLVTWDAGGLTPGIYYCKIISGNKVESTKIVKL